MEALNHMIQGSETWFVWITILVAVAFACITILFIWVWAANKEIKLLWRDRHGRPLLNDLIRKYHEEKASDAASTKQADE